MTKKRFVETISTGIVTDTITKKEYLCEMRIDDKLLELLNELHEENEQLIYALNQRTEQCDKLHKENEKLKLQIQRERVVSTKQHLKWSKEAEEQIQILVEENEQLKQENKELEKFRYNVFKRIGEIND